VSTCGYAEWDGEQCLALFYEIDGRARCAKYKEILSDPRQKLMPAFGFGCCSNLNTYRQPIIEKFHNSVTPTVEINDFF